MSKASDLARLITSGSTTIHGEAGVTSSGSTGLTTNLQEGLCKFRVHHSGDSPTTNESLNMSSLSDEGSGEYAYSFTNNFSTVYFTTTAMSTEDGTIGYVTMYYSRDYTRATSSVHLQGIDQGDSYDDGQYTTVASHGKLA